jgi:hypothetical protein
MSHFNLLMFHLLTRFTATSFTRVSSAPWHAWLGLDACKWLASLHRKPDACDVQFPPDARFGHVARLPRHSTRGGIERYKGSSAQ